jgi:AraC-like DNA-binding protein
MVARWAGTIIRVSTSHAMNNTAHPTSKQRFIQNLAESQLFQSQRQAFQSFTGLALNLRQPEKGEHDLPVPEIRQTNGLTQARVVVKLGKNVFAMLETSPARPIPPGDDAFHAVAKAMLDQDHTAASISAAKARFDSHPGIEASRLEAGIIIMRAYATQLSESLQRTLFASSNAEPEAVRKAKAFIHDHLTENLSLETVAAAASISPFHFCKLFKRATGLTFTDFVNHVRVGKARRLLMRPTSRITEIAYDVGFQSLSHFNRSFRRITSESPTEFRSRLKSSDEPAAVAA